MTSPYSGAIQIVYALFAIEFISLELLRLKFVFFFPVFVCKYLCGYVRFLVKNSQKSEATDRAGPSSAWQKHVPSFSDIGQKKKEETFFL